MLSTLHNKALTKRRNAEQGFTLIELLVVIVIIGILAAIAIPAFLNQRATARDASVTSDLRNAATEVQTALAQYPDATHFTVSSGTHPTNTSVGPEMSSSRFVKGNSESGKATFFIGKSRAAGEYITVTMSLSGDNQIAIYGVPVTTGSTTMKPGEYVISVYNEAGKVFNTAANAQKWNSAQGGLQN